MPKRIATIMAPKDLGEAGTEPISIKTKDVISRIAIMWRATNVTVSVMLDAVTACISKVELIDGSEVLSSVEGAELQAVNFYDNKVLPNHKVNLTVGGYFECQLNLDFGRKLWDPLFGFDPKRFVNPQLMITWDEDACNTSVVVNELGVYAYAFGDEMTTPNSMLVNRQVKKYAMAASSHGYTDIPVDRPIRKIIVRGLSEAHDPITLFDTIKLGIDNDKHQPYNMKAAMLEKVLASMYPRIVEEYTLDAVVTAKTLYSALSQGQSMNIEYDETPVVTTQSLLAQPVWTGAKCALAASVDLKADRATVSGRMPGNCFPLDFGDGDDPDTWLQAQNFGSIELDLLGSSDADSGDTTSIIVQQNRPY
ncbi:MAG: hypothetical protein KAV87_63075 [Desulfobacteraceae bacterium]|nr:hypothetical protein [Desulfobacteraceae bacterium]